MPQPQIFGAPAPSDPGSAFAANIRATGDAAQMMVQAKLQTAKMIQDSLTAAMEIRERRASQMREIEARATLARQQALSEERQQQAANTAAMQRQKAQIEAERANALTQERGAVQRARIGERGAAQRQERSLAQDASQFAERMELERLQFEEQKRTNQLLSEGRALELRQGYEGQRLNEQIKSLKALVPQAMAAGVMEGGPITGTQLPNIGAIQGFLDSLRQPQGQVGPPTAQQNAVGSPGAEFEFAQLLQQFTQSRNDLAEKKYAVDDPMGGQGGGGLSGGRVIGRLDVSTQALEALRPLARNAADGQVLDTLIQHGNTQLPTYDPTTGEFRTPQIAGLENSDEVLDRLVNTGLGTRERFTGMLVAPMMGPSEQTKEGANVLGTGRATPRRDAPQSVPRGTPAQGQAAPPAASAAPQEPAQQPTGAAPTGDAEPKIYGTQDAIQQRVENQIATDEQRTRTAKERFKAQFGVGKPQAAQEPERSPQKPQGRARERDHRGTRG